MSEQLSVRYTVSPTAESSRLPYEILLVIFQQVRETCPTADLLSCLLVCSLWLAPAQEVLLRALSPHTYRAAHSLLELLKNNPRLASFVVALHFPLFSTQYIELPLTETICKIRSFSNPRQRAGDLMQMSLVDYHSTLQVLADITNHCFNIRELNLPCSTRSEALQYGTVFSLGSLQMCQIVSLVCRTDHVQLSTHSMQTLCLPQLRQLTLMPACCLPQRLDFTWVGLPKLETLIFVGQSDLHYRLRSLFYQVRETLISLSFITAVEYSTYAAMQYLSEPISLCTALQNLTWEVTPMDTRNIYIDSPQCVRSLRLELMCGLHPKSELEILLPHLHTLEIACNFINRAAIVHWYRSAGIESFAPLKRFLSARNGWAPRLERVEIIFTPRQLPNRKNASNDDQIEKILTRLKQFMLPYMSYLDFEVWIDETRGVHDADIPKNPGRWQMDDSDVYQHFGANSVSVTYDVYKSPDSIWKRFKRFFKKH